MRTKLQQSMDMSDNSRPVSTVDSSRELMQALQRPHAFPHPVSTFQLLETHISWVLLTGDFAYKFKKPVDLGFANFSTLERRRRFCEEEIRLNARLAPDIYLDCRAVTGTIENPTIGGDGDVLEYCVCMRQFPQDQLLSNLAANGTLGKQEIDQLVQTVSKFHLEIPKAPQSTDFGSPEAVSQALFENFASLKRVPELRDSTQLSEMEHWCRQEVAGRFDLLRLRKEQGFVRECHGDMHLGNMVLLDGRVTIFDGIDFNAELRWIDVMSELAFCMMDLIHQERPDLAWRFLNGCLRSSGDYNGLAVLPLYLVYRALVRAKVAAIRMAPLDVQSAQRETSFQELISYLKLADRLIHRGKPFLAITHGLSGSGKSYGAEQLSERTESVWIRSDVERKRRGKAASEQPSAPAPQSDLYTTETTLRVYSQLGRIAESIVGAGYPVIVDATFLARSQRDSFREIARQLNVPFLLIDFPTDADVCRERIRKRSQQQPSDPSDATVDVFEHQLRAQDPLTREELEIRIPFDSVETTCHQISQLV